jgi:hypothetical protein
MLLSNLINFQSKIEEMFFQNQSDFSEMPSSEQNSDECDATDDDSSNAAGQNIPYLRRMTIEKLNDMRSRIAGVRRFL